MKISFVLFAWALTSLLILGVVKAFGAENDFHRNELGYAVSMDSAKPMAEDADPFPDPIKVGRWSLKIQDAAKTEATLEIIATPSCGYGFAAYAKIGNKHSLLPGSWKRGFIRFQIMIEDKIHDAYFTPSDPTKMTGVLEKFQTGERVTAEANFVSADHKLRSQLVWASSNTTGQAIGESKTWFIRSPNLAVTKGEIIFHADTREYYGCYALDQVGGYKAAFTYSDSPMFIVPATDLKPNDETVLWIGAKAAVPHLQLTPTFVLSLVDGVNAIDFVARRP